MECATQGDCDMVMTTDPLPLIPESEWSAPLKAIATEHLLVRDLWRIHVRMECAAQGDCDIVSSRM